MDAGFFLKNIFRSLFGITMELLDKWFEAKTNYCFSLYDLTLQAYFLEL